MFARSIDIFTLNDESVGYTFTAITLLAKDLSASVEVNEPHCLLVTWKTRGGNEGYTLSGTYICVQSGNLCNLQIMLHNADCCVL